MTKLTFKQFLLNEVRTRDERYGEVGDRDPELWTHLITKYPEPVKQKNLGFKSFPGYEYYTIRDKNGVFVLTGWKEPPSHSVMAGQILPHSLAYYKTADEAIALNPGIEFSHPMMEPKPSFNHIRSDDEIEAADYDNEDV